MSPKVIILVVAIAVALELVVFTAVFYGLRLAWQSAVGRFPRRAPAPDAVSRRFQSFRLGLFNLGGCIHASADEAHLHLEPVGLLRRIGLRPASVPWDAIKVVRRSRSGRWASVRIGSHTLQGPAWCLDLADPAGPPKPDAGAPV